MPRKLPGHFLGHSGEPYGAEITEPKTFSWTLAAAKMITGTVLDLCSSLHHHAYNLSLGKAVQCVCCDSNSVC